MKVLVVNAGSSSLKFTMFNMSDQSVLCKGLVERIGLKSPRFIYQRCGEAPTEEVLSIVNHNGAMQAVCYKLIDPEQGVLKNLTEVEAIGHRVVHGGERFTKAVKIDKTVKDGIRQCAALAPLHNPPNLEGIEACEGFFPGVPGVAVFDTAFHQSMQPEAYLYALPRNLYNKLSIRKYGFHGTSHKYVYYEGCRFLGLDPETARVLVCHLGNGSSITAVKGGKVLDTSMGMTPLMGLVMGTRCGVLDAGVVLHLIKNGYTVDEVDVILNKKSGLQGVSGVSSDMRDIEAARLKGNTDAQEAFDLFVHRLLVYIGGYHLLLGGAEAILFTGGIGENSVLSRQAIVSALEAYGCELDEEANQKRQINCVISKPGSKLVAAIIPTNEELMIAQEAMELI
ncbi:MAG: acetate kinase [Lentisphaeria bacterium]|nr:acetate kinase [Lentisphaeria bacterium]MDY0175689.1 acetate kinase [Lentisphaeria bacterium]NLZ61039.1 acetate kinase [Lentisphaerota bacterium]